MTEARTYEATPRRLARARARFGRPVSPELSAAAALGVAAIALPIVAAALVRFARTLWGQALHAAQAPVPADAFEPAAARQPAMLLGALLGSLALVAGVATWLQRGALRSERAIPLPRSRAFTLLKFALLAIALLWPWSDAVRGMLSSWQRAPGELTAVAWQLGCAILVRAAIALALIGALDLGLAQLAWRRHLRMSRRELQEEARATEGDPHARAERRRRAHEQRMQATLLELSEVSAIVYDETRAVALRGRVVWIKADGELARGMLAAATERGIPTSHRPALTDALLAFEPNETLPAPLQLQLRAAERTARD